MIDKPVTESSLKKALKPYVTRAELQAAIEQLATKAELKAAIEPLATKAEMKAAIAEAIAPLATKADLDRVVARISLVVDRVAEQIRSALDGYSSIREHQAALDKQVAERLALQDGRIDNLDVRVLRMEQATAPSS